MPSSAAKLESARTNGTKSRGPITDRGRHAVALNAVKHGLTAQTVILRNESSEEFQAELQGYIDHFRPQGQPELDLVHQLTAAGWRLARYAGVESALLDHKMDEQANWVNKEYPGIPEKQRVAIAFDALASSSPSLALANRYQARLHHEYQRVLKALLQMQATRAKLQNKPNSDLTDAATDNITNTLPAAVPTALSADVPHKVTEPRPSPQASRMPLLVRSQVQVSEMLVAEEAVPNQPQSPPPPRSCYPEDSCAVSFRSSSVCLSPPPRRPHSSTFSAMSCNAIFPF